MAAKKALHRPLIPLLTVLLTAGAAAAETPETAYLTLRAQARELAGAPGDIARRAALLRRIYRHSGGNHVFPLIAAHGALWAKGFFETSGPVGEAISYRYFYDRDERHRRLAMLEEFADDLERANRQVFIDTYVNYYFTLDHGDSELARRLIEPGLLEALNATHRASADGRRISRSRRGETYRLALLWEQERTVARRVREAVRKFDCPILRSLVLKPWVRFKYFPWTRVFLFQDFSDKAERIHYALEAYELAEETGLGRVDASLDRYN